MQGKKVQQFSQEFLKKNLPDIKVGDTVKVHQKIKEGEKERLQVFEGIILSLKHGKGINGTFTVRKIISGVGVEKTYPLHSPSIAKIEIISRGKVRRAKLYYLRDRAGKKAKLKRQEYIPVQEALPAEEPDGKPKKTMSEPKPQKESSQTH